MTKTVTLIATELAVMNKTHTKQTINFMHKIKSIDLNNNRVKSLMKTLKEITSTIEALKPQLREQFKVKTIGVFGSSAMAKKPSRVTLMFWWNLRSP